MTPVSRTTPSLPFRSAACEHESGSRPSRSARPTIAPSHPAAATASRSSGERMPPAASTGRLPAHRRARAARRRAPSACRRARSRCRRSGGRPRRGSDRRHPGRRGSCSVPSRPRRPRRRGRRSPRRAVRRRPTRTARARRRRRTRRCRPRRAGLPRRERFGVCKRADPSRRLHRDRVDGGHDGLDERRVDPTRAGRSEVDEMDQLRATRCELSRERQGVGAPRDDAVERATLEPNGFSFEHVECWNDRESILSS